MANEFFTILTATGKAKLAAAQTSGTPLQITQMAVGDGDNGAYYNPVESQTALKHETWRGALNNLSVDQTNPNWIVAELVIPDTVGGFYIREVGLFDNTGALIAVGKFPESYKPTLAAGSNKQLYVRMILEVSNASTVTLLIDPSVVLATRATVDQRIAEELAKLDGKPSVKVATTAAIALTGLQTIDGVALAAGDRVLVKDQAAAKDNGIYVVATGAWARAADADASIEVTPGLFVSVEQGAANADSIWQLVTDAPITLGTTGLAFEMVDGKTGVVAGTYRSVTVNHSGQVVGGTNPTTIAGYGISGASQADAEAGVDDSKPMTPLRVFQAIAAKVIQATENALGIAKVATQAIVDAGTDDATIVTPKKLRWGFSISKGPNGYVALPSWLGGLIFQWGKANLAADTFTTLTFPIAFPTACLSITGGIHYATARTDNGAAAQFRSLSLTSVILDHQAIATSTGFNVDVYFIALGY